MYGPVSTYPFVCERSSTLLLTLTCRIPGALETGELSVKINEKQAASLPIDSEWRTTRFTADASLVNEGLNRLTLGWPLGSRSDLRPQLRHDFDTGRQLDVRTHFGQLHTLQLAMA